ncbi:Tn3 family transposase [Nonomuraea sp. NPDC050547]|uniref:Tn3 family transposase n=1 Tax=Nonomuraea sp. NPDC050547 TaxID=3364368 RepID=UPI0037AA3B7A
MNIHGGRVLSTYTHVSDQWSPYGTKQIVPTTREGHCTLDEMLGNATDLPIHEHATDTHGATLVNFGLFDLVGKVLTPGCGTWAGSPCSGLIPRRRPARSTRTPGRCRPTGGTRT